MFHVTHPLILASASPRRQQFLRELGVEYLSVKPDVIEPQPVSAEDPVAYAGRVASLKAAEVADRYPGRVVIAADTIVVIDQDILGKPADEADSLRMLKRLSGRTHAVITAVHVILSDASHRSFACRSLVRFHAWPHAVLAAYACSGESLDKAGAYAVQGIGAFLVAEIEGSWSSVVGLPMAELTALLLQHDVIRIA